MPLADFPKIDLLSGHSLVQRLERLGAHLGGEVDVWAKRDDCNSGLAYRGNKVRKLEYLAADALAQGCDTLVSIGGVRSNHTRQVAAVAARLGLGCVLVQEYWVDWEDPVYDRVGNILLSRIMGADVRLSDAGFDIGIRPSWEEALRSVEDAGSKPYAIPAGASDHPLGGLGFASWAAEVAEQERAFGVFFDTVVVCSVTGSTQAEMIAGFAGQERERTVLGIDGSATVRQTWSKSPGSPDLRPRRSVSAASSQTRRSCCSTGGTRRRTASLTSGRSMRSVCARGSRGCSPTRSTRGSPWPR
jgi:1-aminocyclopropane-1-carboxylate deaminase